MEIGGSVSDPQLAERGQGHSLGYRVLRGQDRVPIQRRSVVSWMNATTKKNQVIGSSVAARVGAYTDQL